MEDEEGTCLGMVFMDLFPRPNKFGGSAHFTVRCGFAKRGEGHAGDCQPYHATAVDKEVGKGPHSQVPIIAVVLNLSGGPQSHGDVSPSLLTLQELELLYHE